MRFELKIDVDPKVLRRRYMLAEVIAEVAREVNTPAMCKATEGIVRDREGKEIGSWKFVEVSP